MAGRGTAHPASLVAARVWCGHDPHQRRDGSPWFDFPQRGVDILTLLDLAATHQPLTTHPGVTHWTNVLEGLQAIGGDVLAEVTGISLFFFR